MNADHDTIVTEASDWIARLHGREPDRADREALEAWMAQSAQHRGTIQRLAQQWQAMNVLTELAVPQPRALPSTGGVEARSGARAWPRGWWTGWAAAACTLLVTFAWLSAGPEQGEEQAQQTYVTARGVQEHVLLPDGSVVVLNSGSSLSLDFSPEARRVHLNYGEGHFDVAKDKRRPFRVEAGNSVFSAVGTAFAVRVSEEAVEITVEEGEVRLSEARPSGSRRSLAVPAVDQLPLLRVGDRVLVARDGDAVIGRERISGEEMSRALAWREGRVLFNGETMAEVVAELNRHTRARIVIDSEELQSLRIGGAFDIGETQKFLDTLQVSFGLRIRYEGDFVYISAASES